MQQRVVSEHLLRMAPHLGCAHWAPLQRMRPPRRFLAMRLVTWAVQLHHPPEWRRASKMATRWLGRLLQRWLGAKRLRCLHLRRPLSSSSSSGQQAENQLALSFLQRVPQRTSHSRPRLISLPLAASASVRLVRLLLQAADRVQQFLCLSSALPQGLQLLALVQPIQVPVCVAVCRLQRLQLHQLRARLAGRPWDARVIMTITTPPWQRWQLTRRHTQQRCRKQLLLRAHLRRPRPRQLHRRLPQPRFLCLQLCRGLLHELE